MNIDCIQTPRLILRTLTPEVYEYVFTRYSKPELMEFFGCATEREYEEEYKKFNDGLSMYRKSLLIFQLIEKESNKVIGWCGYHTWYLNHDRAEIGYAILDESKKQKGFMKEALKEVINYGFIKMGLKRIEALLAPDNNPSLKLVTAFGFQKEGVLREHYLTKGRYEDSVMFSLLEREFQTTPLNSFEPANSKEL